MMKCSEGTTELFLLDKGTLFSTVELARVFLSHFFSRVYRRRDRGGFLRRDPTSSLPLRNTPAICTSMAAMGTTGAKTVLHLFDGLRLSPPAIRVSAPSVGVCGVSSNRRSFQRLVVKAATVIAPKYTSIKPLGDRVLVKIKSSEEKTMGGVLLPSTAQTKPEGGEVVAVGEGKTIGKNKVDASVKAGAQVVYSKYAGTELEFNGSSHLILKEDDIVGVLETDDVKDLKPLNDRVLIKVAEAEEKTLGGLLLTEASKEKPSIGMVVAVGSGLLDEEGNRKPLTITPGNTVLYSKYAGNEFKSADGSDYITLRVSDVMAILS